MSQSDYNIGANPSGLAMRTEINTIFNSILTNNSGSTAPTTTSAFMMWVDTSNATYYYLKMRNHDDTAWVTLFRYTVSTKIIEVVNNGTDLTTSLALKAALASPTFTGVPAAPTATLGTNTTQIATTAFVNAEISNDVGTANNGLIKTALNASGTAPIYACRAWVNFNGTGTVAIRASGNVSSITDNGVGNYTVNFNTAMSGTNYSIIWGNDTEADNVSNFSLPSPSSARQLGFISSLKTTSSFTIYSGASSANGTSARLDFREINISIFI